MATDSTKTENDGKTGPADAVPEGHDEREETRGTMSDDDKAQADDGEGKPAEETAALTKNEAEAPEGGSHAADADAAHDDERDLAPAGTASRGWGGGAAAVISAGLGLVSLTGTSFSDMIRERKSLIGQIESGPGGGGGDQVNALYGAPWHAAALVNGIFALLAVLVGGLLMAALTGREDTKPWVKAVGLGGLVLGVLGLIVAGGMYFDLFAGQPELPSAPQGGAGQ